MCERGDRGSGERNSPVGSRDKAPVGCLGTIIRLLQKLKLFALILMFWKKNVVKLQKIPSSKIVG